MGLNGRTLFLLLVLKLCLLRISFQLKYFNVSRCPRTEQSWKQQSKRLNCTSGSSFYEYHCLPTNENSLIELCYTAIAFAPKDGCPYFSMDNGFGILQRECIGNKSGCPEAISNKSVVSSNGYKFPNCLIIPAEVDDEAVSSIRVSKRYITAEIEDTTERKQTSSRSGNIAKIKGLYFSFPVLLLGGGIFLSICLFIGCVAFFQFKRITQLQHQVESANYMSSVPYNASGSHPYQESENESTYDYAYNVNETNRPVSETASYLEPNTKSNDHDNQSNQPCNNGDETRDIAAAVIDSKI